MKNCFSKFILAGLLAIAAALPVAAQNIGLYTLVPTGVVALYGGSTNVFLTYVQTNWVGSNPATNAWNGVIITNTFGYLSGPTWTTNQVTVGTNVTGSAAPLTASVSSFDNAGFSLQFSPIGGSTNPIGCQIFRSYNFGASYETNAGWTFTNTAANLTTYTVATNLPMQGVTTLGFNFYAISAVGAGVASNLTATVNLKAPTQQYVQAGIYSAPTTPTPIITSTNWVQ